MNNKNGKLKKVEQGDTLLEFAMAIPILILVLGFTGIFAYAFWMQSAAAMVAAQGARESGFDRGGYINPSAGVEVYTTGVFKFLGSSSGSRAGTPEVATFLTQRQIRLNLSEFFDVNFGGLLFDVGLTGGGASRWHDFYEGPPDPWE